MGDFKGKKNALAELVAASGFLPSRVCLVPGLETELHRSELYEVFYADLTNAQSIDEPLDDLDD